MKALGCAFALIAVCLIGCETANEIGHTLTSPVRYVFNQPEPTAAPNTSDVTYPGRPLPPASPTPSRMASRRMSSASPIRDRKATRASPSPTASVASTQFPVAKPVPGKPGLVFNPFDSHGGYIDVSGYAPGSKVKDPATQKIFVVP